MILAPVLAQAQSPKAMLDSVIGKYQSYRSFDWQEYPLGNYEEERYKKDKIILYSLSYN